MKQNYKKLTIIGLIVGALLLIILFYTSKQGASNISHKNLELRQTVLADNIKLQTYLPTTDQASRTGLAAFDNFSDDQSMLFRVPSDIKPSLWMKDMKFDIDMVWLSQNDEVVHIHHDVSHRDQSTIYQAPLEANVACVIELNAGASKRHNIKLGDKFKFIDSDEPLCLDRDF